MDDFHESLRWIPASVDAIEATRQYTSIDYVLNMACNYGRSNILYDNILEANIEFPLKVLNTVAEHGIKRFLTIGTGLPDELNMYSFSKKMFGEFGNYYVNKHHIVFNNLLLEMFYGADEPENRFLPSLITNMMMGKAVETTIGTQHRDIIAVEDVVEAILVIIHAELTGYNEIPIGTGVAPTISEIIDYIWEETDRKSIVTKGSIPMREDEPECVADTSFMDRLCDWHPIYWKDGLKKMIERKKTHEDTN